MAIMKMRDFFERVNQAFLYSDTAFIKENVTEDVVWTMAGEGIIRGKTEFIEFMEKMEKEDVSDGTLTIENIITDGPQAAVIGKMTGTMKGETKTFMYCDIYLLDEQQNGKIIELTSFVTEVKE